METGVTPLTDPGEYFRQKAVGSNLAYLQQFLADHDSDAVALAEARRRVMNAIKFGLSVADQWAAVFTIIDKYGPFTERQGQWADWQDILLQALAVAERRDDRAGVITLYLLLARLAQRQSDAQATIRYYRLTIRHARRNNDPITAARACSNLGYHYTEHGFWHRAEVLCCWALAVFSAQNHLHGLAHTHNHLGLLYSRQRRWTEARSHLAQACSLWQENNDPHGLMFGRLNQGMLFNEMEDFRSGLSYLQAAEQLALMTGEMSNLLATVYLNMSYSYRNMGNSEKTIRYARLAEEQFRKLNHTPYLIFAWIGVGRGLTLQGALNEAESYLTHALATARQINYVFGQVEALTGLLDYAMARKDLELAGHWFSQLVDVANQSSVPVKAQIDLKIETYRHSLREVFPQAATFSNC